MVQVIEASDRVDPQNLKNISYAHTGFHVRCVAQSVNGGGEAVEAAQMGKLAAQGIHKTLTGESVQFAGASVPSIDPSGGHKH